MELDADSVLTFIQGVGFPAAVAWFVLVRVEKRLASIETALVAWLERGSGAGERPARAGMRSGAGRRKR